MNNNNKDNITAANLLLLETFTPSSVFNSIVRPSYSIVPAVFSPVIFDCAYPDDKGKSEATKRLLSLARCYIHKDSLGSGSFKERQRLFFFLNRKMMAEEETAHYIKLIGVLNFRNNLIAWIESDITPLPNFHDIQK